MKPAITISLVPEARGGPFVFWDDLATSCQVARALGFATVEIFPAGPEVIDSINLAAILDELHITVAAFGTGAGWVKHQLTLTSPEPEIRGRAIAFVKSIIDCAARVNAPAILGSMQGRAKDLASRPETLKLLGEALVELGRFASAKGQVLLYEPLNRYETNLINRLDDAAQFVNSLETPNVKLLADLFHMNIEEASIADAIRAAGSLIGHVHFADSNRRAVGMGHTDIEPIIAALHEIGYKGYLSAEVFAWPDSRTAAIQTLKAFRQYVLS